MSKFALVAQAAGLLGQVIKHVSRNNAHQVLRDEEIQLDRTLHALIKAAEAAKFPKCDPIGICYRYICTATLQMSN